jgi:hypothetical protein
MIPRRRFVRNSRTSSYPAHKRIPIIEEYSWIEKCKTYDNYHRISRLNRRLCKKSHVKRMRRYYNRIAKNYEIE